MTSPSNNLVDNKITPSREPGDEITVTPIVANTLIVPNEANNGTYTLPPFIQSEFNLPVASEATVPPVLSESAIGSAKTRFVVLPVTSDSGATPVTPNSAEVDAGKPRRESSSDNPPDKNRSDWEIRQQHNKIQKEYKKRIAGPKDKRKRHLTDIDFEGILKIIGGCNVWQILIYLMISAHQVPHAMFNLSVVYYIYQPDHWCKIENFSREVIENHPNATKNGWSWDEVLMAPNIAYRTMPNRQRQGQQWHDQCLYFNRPVEEYGRLLNRPFNEVRAEYENPDKPLPQLKRCTSWEYDNSVMKDTVVTQWNRVCDDNWSRAHVHLSYSLGYLVGCLLGGFICDRYGRKPAIYGFSILSTIFGFLLPFSKEFEVFLIVRFLLATCNEASDLAAYVMCMEWTGVKYRSIVGSLLQAPWACGYALLAMIAYLCKSWTKIQLITSFLHLGALILLHFLPESPRWLIVMNRIDEAALIIRKACRWNKSSLPSDLELVCCLSSMGNKRVDEDEGGVRHAEMRKWAKHNKRPHFLYSFKSRDMCNQNCVIFFVWVATALVYYGLVIALSDQSSPGRAMFVGNFFLNNAVAGAIELPTLMGCVYLLQFGRKRSQMITLWSAGVLIFVAMVSSYYKEMTYSLIFMLAGKVCIQGAFNILYIFTSELYPTVIRNSAVGVCSMVARMGAGASGYIAILSDVTLPIVPMAIFCLFSLVAGMLVWRLPETMNTPLPDTMWDAVTMLRTEKDKENSLEGSQEKSPLNAPDKKVDESKL